MNRVVDEVFPWVLRHHSGKIWFDTLWSDKTKKLENTVLLELIRRGENVHYYKDQIADIDFVLTKENRPCQLIQVCHSINDPTTYSRETNSLLRASQKLNCKNLVIVTFDEEKTINQNEKTIEVLPAWKWLLKKPSNQMNPKP